MVEGANEWVAQSANFRACPHDPGSGTIQAKRGRNQAMGNRRSWQAQQAAFSPWDRGTSETDHPFSKPKVERIGRDKQERYHPFFS